MASIAPANAVVAAVLLCLQPAWGDAARQDAKVIMPADPASRQFAPDWGYADVIVAGDTV